MNSSMHSINSTHNHRLVHRRPSHDEDFLLNAAREVSVDVGSADVTTPRPPLPPLRRKEDIPRRSLRRAVSTSVSRGVTSRRSASPPPADSGNSKQRRTNSGYHSRRGRKVLSVLITIGIAMTCSGLGFFCYRSLQSYLQERDESIREEVRHDELEPQLRDYQRHVDVLLSDQKYLQERLQKAEVTKANIADSSEASESLREQLEKLQVALKEKTRDMATSVQQLEEKLQLQTSYRQRYAQGIQELSREALMDQFGPGPYHVQLEVALQDGDKKKPSSILLELAAAADDVPHTVYTFLRRVAAGLYDGSAFYQKTEHLLAAGAVKVDGTSVKDRFVEAGLDHLYLQEYSEAWPHVPWTVGLAGRPAGTEFYINLLDNQVPHGPGGQTNHADPSQADPCFAKVTKGVEVIQHVEKQVGNVEIVQARILTQKEGEKETRKKKK